MKPETAEAKLAEIEDGPGATKTDAGTTYMQKVKNVRVINPDLIPREYLVIDMVALRRAMLKEGKQVPGAEVFEEKRIGGRMSA